MRARLCGLLLLAAAACAAGDLPEARDGAPCGPGAACAEGLVCVVAPSSGCASPAVAGCAGLCVKPVFCGGIAAIRCPQGAACVDDPRDDCDPSRGADCGGLCAPEGAAGDRGRDGS